MFEEEEWIKFSNEKTQESFSYETSTLVYIIKKARDYDLSTEEGRIEKAIDKMDTIKNCGFVNNPLLVPTIAEQVKIGASIYDENGKYEGYRVE